MDTTSITIIPPAAIIARFNAVEARVDAIENTVPGQTDDGTTFDARIAQAVEKAIDDTKDELASEIESQVSDAIDELDLLDDHSVSRMIDDAIEDLDFVDRDDLDEAINERFEDADFNAAHNAANRCEEMRLAVSIAKDEMKTACDRIAAWDAATKGGFIARLRWLITGK